MSSHFYAFGSICRGDVDSNSDIDILACVSEENSSLSKEKFSIYTYEKIKKLWSEGNPFAWHLYLESKLIYSSTDSDFIRDLGVPAQYLLGKKDCIKFRDLFVDSKNALIGSVNNKIFNLSCMFLATRNFATCYSVDSGKPIFSRSSPFLVEDKLNLSKDTYDILMRARLLSTRGYGLLINDEEIDKALKDSPIILEWMEYLIKVKSYE